jgi:hypothetical protein
VNDSSLKSCSKCEEEKSLSEFYKDSQKKDGYRPYCKECERVTDKIKNKQWRTNNAEKNKLKNKNFYLNRPNYNKEYFQEHKTEIKQTVQAYFEKNREKITKYQREYHLAHPRISNLEKNRTVDNYRYANDIQFKLIKTSRNRINSALKNNQKAGHTLELLGCSIDFFRKHLESQFKPGMSWDNWSFTGWHIDHIKPCDSFNLSNIEEQKICFHWSNQQPLWANDNLKKSNKYVV